MVDSFYVGKINTSAVGAVGIVFSFMTVIQATGFFFGHGSGNYISFMLGKKEGKKASEMAMVSLDQNKLRREAEEGDKKSRAIIRILSDQSNFLSTIPLF